MREVLGIGWNVGGWIGPKQAIAAASISSEGVQWLGTARAFRLRDLGSPDWSLLDLIRLAWLDAPATALELYRVVLAIDAPLGFPRAFTRLLTGGEAPRFDPDARELDNPLAYRECDRHIAEVFGKKPLSASFDKLGNNATVAMHHARRLARLHGARVLPFDPPDEDAHTIMEVYPALSKIPKDTCCYRPIQRLLPPSAIAGTDECDGCICALMALAFAAGRTHSDLPPLVGPDDQFVATARAEGWIYYAPPEWLQVKAM